jgi:hypothetical protein
VIDLLGPGRNIPYTLFEFSAVPPLSFGGHEFCTVSGVLDVQVIVPPPERRVASALSQKPTSTTWKVAI